MPDQHTISEDFQETGMKHPISCLAILILLLGLPTATLYSGITYSLVGQASKSVNDYIREGEALYDTGKYKAALNLFNLAARRHPRSSEVFRQRARCYSRLNNDSKALQDYSKALSINPKNAKAWGGRSAVRWRLKKYNEAVKDAENAMHYDPNDRRYPVFKAMALDSLGNYNQAIKTYGVALNIDPKYVLAWSNRGVSKERSGDYEGGVKDASQAIALDPGYSRAYGNRGICRIHLGDLQGAQADLTKCLKTFPDNSLYLANRALTRFKLRDIEGAREDVRRSLKKSPRQKLALEVQSQLIASQTADFEETVPSKTTTKPRTKPQTNQSKSRPTKSRPPAKTSRQPGPVSPITLTFDMPGRSTWSPPAGRDDPKNWPNRDVLWQTADMPDLELKGPKPMDIPLYLEFGKLTDVAYAAAITTAKEAMRLVLGIMTAEETRKFEEKWAPYYDYPTEEIVDYLNKLNPLLVRFLEARAGYASAAKGMFISLCEAGMADGLQNAEALQSSWAAVSFQKTLLDAYEDAMKQAVKDILALGEMPNPFALRAAHRRRLKEAVEAVRNLEEEEETETGYYYVMKKLETLPSPAASNKQHSYTFNFQEGLAVGSFNNSSTTDTVAPTESSATVKWEPFPRVVRTTDGELHLKIKTSVSLDTFQWHPQINDDLKRITRTLRQSSARLAIGWEMYSGDVGIAAFPRGDMSASIDNRHQEGILEPLTTNYYGSSAEKVAIICQAHTPGGKVAFVYHYEFKELTSDQAAILQAESFDAVEGLKNTEGDLYDISDAQMDEAKTRMFNIQYQIETAAYFKSRAEQVRRELNKTTDLKARKDLSWQLLAYDADMHAAEDSRTFLETGQWVRTRTLFDDYNFIRMETLARETARKAIAASKRVTSALKIIDILPYPHKTAARKIFEKAYVSTNPTFQREDAMREANKEIGEMARNYYAIQERKAMDEERFYKYLEWTAQGTKIVSGIVFIGIGGAVVAGAGGTPTMIWAADTLLGAAYGGATGYAEGGKDEALKQSLEWAGTAGFTLSQGIQGYQETGTISGMVKRGATALILAKAMEYGVKYLRGFGKGAGNVPPGAPNVNADEFRRGLEHGKQLCRNLEKAEWELAQAMSQGSSQGTIDKLTQEATDIAADINASWHAKYFLKQQGPSIVGSAYMNRIEQVYEKMMPEFLENLEKMGYNTSQLAFASTRNAANKHSVSMDLDLALRETQDQVITKNGKQVNLAKFREEAQEALNKAYEKVSRGRSAESSFLNLTTSKYKEAFYNNVLLKGGDDIPWHEVSEYDISQAGDVLRTKMHEAGKLPKMEALVEQSRAAEKEMRTKFLPYLREKIYKARTGGNPAMADKMEKSLKYWEEIYSYYDMIGRKETDPSMIWRLTQKVKHFTGGKAPNQVVDIMATFWEGMAKLTN